MARGSMGVYGLGREAAPHVDLPARCRMMEFLFAPSAGFLGSWVVQFRRYTGMRTISLRSVGDIFRALKAASG